jgi:hypothetical protein
MAKTYPTAAKTPRSVREPVNGYAEGHAPDELYEATRRHFEEKELVDLTLAIVAIVAINGWNRLAISFRKVPGTYQVASH